MFWEMWSCGEFYHSASQDATAYWAGRPREQSDSAMKECETDVEFGDAMLVLRLRAACFECSVSSDVVVVLILSQP